MQRATDAVVETVPHRTVAALPLTLTTMMTRRTFQYHAVLSFVSLSRSQKLDGDERLGGGGRGVIMVHCSLCAFTRAFPSGINQPVVRFACASPEF